MRILKSNSDPKGATGFTLPVVLVVVAALLILAVAVLLMIGIERNTARSFVDRERAELAAKAGLADISGILNLNAANDDYVILQSFRTNSNIMDRQSAPELFLARGETIEGAIKFKYTPLFSALPGSNVAETIKLESPVVGPLLGANASDHADFETLPYQEKVRVAWLPVSDEKGRVVARYAYWTEDLQGKIDPRFAGNLKGVGETHARVPYPFPAPGLNDQVVNPEQPSLDQISLYNIDPAASDHQQRELGKTLIKNRKFLLSPDSILAGAGANPPLSRLSSNSDMGKVGELTDPIYRAAEESLISGIQPYDEQPLVPFVTGIDPSVVGKAKLNINRLVSVGGEVAVNEMSDFIVKAFPTFEDRKGGFPENYVKTLAANAIDYADKDSQPTLNKGEYRGIDCYPLTTEIALKVNYQNMTVIGNRQYLNFNVKLFGELYNPTNLEVSGTARLTYEVALAVDSVGTGTGSPSFDAPKLLDNPVWSTHNLEKIDNRYWSMPQHVSLHANEYKCSQFVEVTYHIDVGLISDNPINEMTPFSLQESKGASGCDLMWNNDIVERQYGMVRQQGFIYGISESGNKTGGYFVGQADTLTKDHLPGLLYQKPAFSAFYGNTGDPRISTYLNRSKGTPLDENAYPANASPNRRSIRLSLYKADEPDKPKVYARTLPSEWPDGGHDSTVGKWSPGTDDKTELTDPKFVFPYNPDAKYSAIQMVSNRGYYFSVTEFGRLFDPIMFAPSFKNDASTVSFRSDSKMPAGEAAWPAAVAGQASPLYGGGNTLRIGREEHPAFNTTGDKENRAIGLLDLFHAGKATSEDPASITGPLVRIHGHVNINTASRDVLRAIVSGDLVMDPKLSKKISSIHAGDPAMAPPTVSLEIGAPQKSIPADLIADAIIAGRPYASPSKASLAKNPDGAYVFGNKDLFPDGKSIQWTDSAAEELFARMYQSATVRSRNFRVWIVAQSIEPSDSLSSPIHVLAEVRKAYTLMADPGVRSLSGAMIPKNIKIRILSSNDF